MPDETFARKPRCFCPDCKIQKIADEIDDAYRRWEQGLACSPSVQDEAHIAWRVFFDSDPYTEADQRAIAWLAHRLYHHAMDGSTIPRRARFAYRHLEKLAAHHREIEGG